MTARWTQILMIFVLALYGCNKSGKSYYDESVFRVPITAMPGLELERGDSVNANKVTDNVYERLIRVDESLSPVPEIASDWKIDATRNEVEFTIGANKRFHDG